MIMTLVNMITMLTPPLQDIHEAVKRVDPKTSHHK